MLPAKTCPGCGADDLGRCRCRTTWQELVRDLSPLRRFRCRACGREGWTIRRLPRSQHPEELLRNHATGRPVGRAAEARDEAARWQGLLRLLVSVALALLLGALAANRLVACQTQAPTAAGE
jgi:hypothetical protein